MANSVELLQKRLITKDISVFLDIIRGVSAQFVLIGHLLSFLKIYPNESSHGPFYIQNFGVLVFFILSGFLIAYSVLNKRKSLGYGFLEYFIERFGRIYTSFLPALFLILFLDIAWILLAEDTYPYFNAFSVTNFLGNVFMLQDFPIYSKITSFGSGKVLWTLAIEWWMYMLFGFIVLFKRISLHIALKILILFVLSIVPLYNLIGGRGSGLTLVWIFGFAILIILEKNYLQVKFRSSVCFVLLFITTSMIRLVINNNIVYDLVFAFLLAAAFLFSINALRETNIFTNDYFNKKVKKFADNSFVLYLIHYSIIEFYLVFYSSINVWLTIIILILFCNVVSYFFAYLTDYKYRHIINWLKIKLI